MTGNVEPVFANICVQKWLNCYTVHTTSKVDKTDTLPIAR
jgi:hypothetical protein